jgi:hypothetical protein
VAGRLRHRGLPGRVGPVATLAWKAAAPRIAWNGSDYLVVWSALGGADTDVAARIVHADATPGPGAVIERAGDQVLPAVAAGGGRFLLAWNERGALAGARFDAQETMKPVMLARSPMLGRPALAGGAGGWALSWTADLGDEIQVVGMALDPALARTSSWISVRLPAAGDADIDDKQPAIATAGDGEFAMVTWQDYADTGAPTVWARPTTAQAPFLVSALP